MKEFVKLINLQMFTTEGEQPTVEEQTSQSDQPEPFAVFPDQESFNKRLSREAKKQLNDTLTGLGVESLEELKSFIENKKAEEEAEKSELQKALERIATLESEKETYVKEQETRKRNELLTSKALEMGVKSDRVERFLKLVETDGKEEDELTEAIQSTLEEFPEFKEIKIEQKAGTDFNEVGKTGAKPALTHDMIKSMSASEIAERIDEVRAVMSAK